MSKQSFTIVFVPADPAASIEEQVLSASTIDEQVSMVTSHAKAHFTRVKDMDSLSAAQKDANQQRMLDTVRKNNPSAQISEAQLSMLATMNLVDTVPLIGAIFIIATFLFECFQSQNLGPVLIVSEQARHQARRRQSVRRRSGRSQTVTRKSSCQRHLRGRRAVVASSRRRVHFALFRQ
jgi:hypothetical protein